MQKMPPDWTCAPVQYIIGLCFGYVGRFECKMCRQITNTCSRRTYCSATTTNCMLSMKIQFVLNLFDILILFIQEAASYLLFVHNRIYSIWMINRLLNKFTCFLSHPIWIYCDERICVRRQFQCNKCPQIVINQCSNNTIEFETRWMQIGLTTAE